MSIVIPKQGRREEEPRSGDYFVLSTRDGWYYVSFATAAQIAAVLERRWMPRWVKFVDLSGARVWIRTSTIESIRESTDLHRASEREFHYRRRKEERDDRRWDDDE